MRLHLAFLLVVGGAVFALGDGNSDFPQTQRQPSQSFGAGSDFTNSYQQPNQDATTSSQSAGNDARAQGRSGQGSGQKGGPSGQQTGSYSGGGQQSGGMQGSDGKKESSDKRAGVGPNGSRDEENDSRDEENDSRDEENDSRDEEQGAAMDLDGARSNFAAVVEAYVAKKSAKGYWSYVPKKGGKSWRLVRPSVDEGSVRSKGGQRYSGLVTVHDARGGKAFSLAFDVDFSGAKWKVIAVKPEAPSVSSRR